MKRSIKIGVVFGLLACVLISCQKEGVFTPKRKISKIYTTNNQGVRELSEVWTWGDKNLERIDYYVRGLVTYSYNFSYQSNRLNSIACDEKMMRIEYQYDNGRLSSAQTYKENKLMAEYVFSHKNGHLHSIKVQYHYADKSPAADNFNPLNFVLSDDLSHTLNKIHEKHSNNSEYDDGEEYHLMWKNGNIRRIDLNYGHMVSAEYDDHLNPFHGALNTLWGDPEINSYSKHNATHIYWSLQGIDNDEYYSYSYDGDYPTSRKFQGEGLVMLTEYEYLP